MPIYSYKCQSCGHVLEKLQRISEAPLTVCTNCEKHELKKQLTAPAFKLKGTGWYETDFKDQKKDTKTDDSVAKPKPPIKSDSDTKPKDSNSKTKSTSKDAA